ncbi:MAG TPA: DUF1097 domain-containing protein [Acidobacteriaceae bacterium]|nr:DUF1097 domain-containing protein [Acidobacteriaceae bacterium]
MNLKTLPAAALAAAILAAVSVWAFAALPGLLIWAAFIGWASFDQSGANRKAFLTSSVCMIFGVIMAWIVAVSVAGEWLHLRSSVSSALAAGVASFFIVLASRFELLSNVPATFYGFASAFAFVTLAPNAFSMAAMTRGNLNNVLLVVPISLLIGSGLGALHGYLAGTLTAPEHLAPGIHTVRLSAFAKSGPGIVN